MSPLLIALLLTILLLQLLLSPALSSGVNITRLPGFSGPLPFQLETGYVQVVDVEFFYYFIRSERKPSEDPLILWLVGGPGCSALASLFFEIGPLRFVITEYDGSLPSLMYNPYSWTKIANVIFLDYPAGTGFSFATSADAYDITDTLSSQQVCNFLIKWYYNHPHFQSNPLYVVGDSYGGKIVPIVTHAIATAGGELAPQFSNLKGYIVGNPVTDDLFDTNSRVQFSHGMGIISDEFYKEIEKNCKGETYGNPNPHNLLCYTVMTKFAQQVEDLNYEYILGRKCPPFSEPKVRIANRRTLWEDEYLDFFQPTQAPDINKCKIEYAYYLAFLWTNNKLTREALHVKEGTVKQWVRCNTSIESMSYTKDVPSTLKYHQDLIQRGYRTLIYSGDHDLMTPFMGTHAWIRSLNFSIVDDWRSWHVDGQVAGYTRKFVNDLTFATVKNAGHTAPQYQPENCFAMFSRWISHERL